MDEKASVPPLPLCMSPARLPDVAYQRQGELRKSRGTQKTWNGECVIYEITQEKPFLTEKVFTATDRLANHDRGTGDDDILLAGVQVWKVVRRRIRLDQLRKYPCRKTGGEEVYSVTAKLRVDINDAQVELKFEFVDPKWNPHKSTQRALILLFIDRD